MNLHSCDGLRCNAFIILFMYTLHSNMGATIINVQRYILTSREPQSNSKMHSWYFLWTKLGMSEVTSVFLKFRQSCDQYDMKKLCSECHISTGNMRQLVVVRRICCCSQSIIFLLELLDLTVCIYYKMVWIVQKKN